MLREIEKGKYYCHDWGCGALNNTIECDCGHDADATIVDRVLVTQTLPTEEKKTKEPEWIVDLRKRGFKFGPVDHSWKPKDRNLI